jgi:hypothetical protein
VADPGLHRLLDEADIRRVLQRYSRAIDRMDWELLRSCYHPGAVDEHGSFHGPVDEFVDWVRPRLEEYDWTKHFLGNQLIELDGDVAWSETYCLAFHRVPAADGRPPLDRLVSVRYVDRFERRDGEWRIAHRVTVYEPGRIDPVVEEPQLSPTHAVFTRDRSDHAYRRDL